MFLNYKQITREKYSGRCFSTLFIYFWRRKIKKKLLEIMDKYKVTKGGPKVHSISDILKIESTYYPVTFGGFISIGMAGQLICKISLWMQLL